MVAVFLDAVLLLMLWHVAELFVEQPLSFFAGDGEAAALVLCECFACCDHGYKINPTVRFPQELFSLSTNFFSERSLGGGVGREENR